MEHHNSTTSQRTLFTVQEFVQQPEFSYLTQSAVRHLIFNSRDRLSSNGGIIAGNGLTAAGAFIRIGRKLLIDAGAFRNWTASQRVQG